MDTPLAQIREIITAEILQAYPDFDFYIATDDNGNLTADYRGKWQSGISRDPKSTPFLTIGHDGDRFLISHYRWNDRKKYKTMAGATRYINDELKKVCDSARLKKSLMDAEKTHTEKAVVLLKEFQANLYSHGIESKLCLVADKYAFDHIHVEAIRVNTDMDVTVTKDYQIEISLSYRRFTTAPDAAIEVISVLATKGTQ